jgi:type II secretory pathway pseudopilin PulG
MHRPRPAGPSRLTRRLTRGRLGASRGWTLLELAVALGLFAAVLAFALPRVVSVGRASQDSEAKASLNATVSAEVGVRASALSFAAHDSSALKALVPEAELLAGNVVSTAATQVSVSVGTGSNAGSVGLAARAKDSACWLVRLDANRVRWAVGDNVTCTGAQALTTALTSASAAQPTRGTGPDMPIQL